MRFFFVIVWVCCLGIAGAIAQENATEGKQLPSSKDVTAEALAQALNRSSLAKNYLDDSESVQETVQNASADKRSALKALVGTDITLLWMQIDFFTLIAHQAHMEATAALDAGGGSTDKEEGDS